MGKNPAFLFYPGDWTRDLDDQDLEVEGAWIRICCRLWWSDTRGQATKPIREWARILRKTEKKTTEILKILIEKGIASGSVLDNQNSTIISRRMVKDNEISKIRREVGKLGGNPNLKKSSTELLNQSDNQNPTLSVSVSVSSSKKEKILKKKASSCSDDFMLFWNAYPKRSGSKKAAFENWQRLNGNRPDIDTILQAITKQTEWRNKAGPDEFRPEWKDPERWIRHRMWEADVTITEQEDSITRWLKRSSEQS